MAMQPTKRTPLKVALAGAGMISWYHLVGWRKLGERVRLVAVCDPDAAKAAKRAEEFAIPKTYRDADAMLAKGLRLMVEQGREQILPDGGHYERSAMYHAIALVDYLDVINALGRDFASAVVFVVSIPRR